MQTIKVIILGGGVAGMSAAQEFAERNGDDVRFDIHIYEKRTDAVGGKARSTPVLTRPGKDGLRDGYPVPGWEDGDKYALPGEHGFRFFPGFYRHLPDTLSHIPYKDKHVISNLVEARELQLAGFDKEPIIAATKLPTSLGEFIKDLKELFYDKHDAAQWELKDGEVEFFAHKMWQILTSCAERRMACYENQTWKQFLTSADSDNPPCDDEESSAEEPPCCVEESSKPSLDPAQHKFSPAYYKLLVNGLSRSLLANDPNSASARTVGNTNIQLLFDMTNFGGHADRLLNGPTSLVWLEPWRDYLQGKVGTLKGNPVRFHMGAQVQQIQCQGEAVSAVKIIENGQEELIQGDVYLFCLPVERMAEVLENSQGADALKDLDNIIELKKNVGRMNGIQFFLKKDVKIVDGHSLYVDSPWALTSISEMQFWSKSIDIERCDDHQVRGILSVCISDWDTCGIFEWDPPEGGNEDKDKGKSKVHLPAKSCTREQIRQEVWAQLKKSLNVGGVTQLEDDDLHSWYLDEDVKDDPSHREGLYTDLEPLFVNTACTWQKRPEAVTSIPNLFLASDYVRTYTDVACMEAANEAARRAVNGVLDKFAPNVRRCKLWKLHEPGIFRSFRQADEAHFKHKQCWSGDIGPVGWAGDAPYGKFVERGGMQCHLQPFDCDDITLYGFLIEGQIDSLQRLVDRYLNEPTAGATDYQVLSNHVLVTFAYVARGTSTQEPDKDMGYIPETSCTLWILTAAYREGKAERVAMFVPYIVVDNAWSMAAGREVYGFPKEYGEFAAWPATIEDATSFSVKTLVLDKYSPDTLAQKKTLIQIDRTDSKSSTLKEAWEALKDAGETLLEAWGKESLHDLPSHLLDDLIHHEVPAVFLKQFRDVVNGRLACYQAIVETGVRVTELSEGGRLDGKYTCQINQYASHPLQTDLGLTSDTVPASLPFYLKFSFESGNGAEIWRANKRKKIAILGGGVGAMTAAYELTEIPNWQEQYEITVYQMGWRLGGKGASGRNAEKHQRIEEHGLHLWFGYYENAFNLMRRCYKALDRPASAPLSAWDKAFRPHGEIVIAEAHGDQWSTWPVPLPMDGYGQPGDGHPSTVLHWLERLVEMMWHAFENYFPKEHLDKPEEHPGWLHKLAESVGHFVEEVSHTHPLQIALKMIRKYAEEAGEELAEEALRGVLKLMQHFVEPNIEKIERLLEGKTARKIEEWTGVDHDLKRLAEILSLGWVNFKGIVEDDVIVKGFDHLNDQDYREWMQGHGGGERALNSDFIRVAYETIFAFEDGDTERPNLAAGVALHGLMRLCFGWKGAVMWKMQAGMGDTVFTPLYQVLHERGVEFKFFHEVKQLGLSADKGAIETIRIAEQVQLKGKEYDPLVPVKDLPCWPSEPRYEQIVNGDELKARRANLESAWADWPDYREFSLRRGIDFDDVILGISMGALPNLCGELIQASDAWKQMVDHVTTVQTQAFQLWAKPSLEALGWKVPKDNSGDADNDPRSSDTDDNSRTPVLGGYAQPQNTWADMSHLIKREDWPADDKPGSIAYFCGPMEGPATVPPASDRSFPQEESARAKSFAIQWVRDNVCYLWPDALRKGMPSEELRGFPESFRWENLIDPENNPGVLRFDYQYWRANFDPSERYVLSTKGSIRYRLRSDNSGFDNLYLAGDWTLNGLNIGCVEAAATSGIQAAQAITGRIQRRGTPSKPSASKVV